MAKCKAEIRYRTDAILESRFNASNFSYQNGSTEVPDGNNIRSIQEHRVMNGFNTTIALPAAPLQAYTDSQIGDIIMQQVFSTANNGAVRHISNREIFQDIEALKSTQLHRQKAIDIYKRMHSS